MFIYIYIVIYLYIYIYIEILFLHIETCQFLLLVPRFRPKNHQDVIAAAEDADQPKVWKLR